MINRTAPIVLLAASLVAVPVAKMRKLTAVIAIGLFLCVSPSADAQTVDDGVAAYKRRDYATALSILEPLAMQGNATAQTKLGSMHLEGRGLPRDNTQSYYWYRKSAEQGNAEGEVSLGMLYVMGWGVSQDYVVSHMWYNIAASLGGASSESAYNGRIFLEIKMTEQQIARAQELARRCFSSNYSECD